MKLLDMCPEYIHIHISTPISPSGGEVPGAGSCQGGWGALALGDFGRGEVRGEGANQEMTAGA